MKTRVKTITLKHGERLLAVVPERCSGPGWSNTPVWVYIQGTDNELREECIQPGERTEALHTLFSPGCAMVDALLASVPVKRLPRPKQQ